MNRNSSKLLEKARKIAADNGVAEAFPGAWRVTSTSGKFYAVTLRRGQYTCSCDWQKFHPREATGCSHVLAVKVALEAAKDRRVYAHSGEDAAKRQHRPMRELGQNLYATTRIS